MATRGRPRKRPPPYSGLSALIHGNPASMPVLPILESEEDWHSFYDGLVASYAPVGDAEHLFTYRVAVTAWRLQRLIQFEIHVFRPTDKFLETLDAFRLERETAGKVVFPLRPFPAEPYVERIQRYEAHLHRLFLRDLHELEALQARRRGEPAPLARFDVN